MTGPRRAPSLQRRVPFVEATGVTITERAIDTLSSLIAFPTVSDRSNLELLAFVEARLAEHGIDAWRVPDASGTKANLLATIGTAQAPGVILSGHTDVVPVEGQAWSSDPFQATRRDGRIVGRGAADMKGFLAVVLALVPELRAMALRRPIHLAFSYDEEVGCKGVPHLIAALDGLLPHRPWGCLIGEPTLMRPVDGHKGKAASRCTVRGRPGHSAYPEQAANAVMAAARLIERIAVMGRELRLTGPRAQGFEPPWSTASVGRIEGGSQINIVPERCTFEFEFRSIPGVDAGALVEELRAFALTEVLPPLRAVAPEALIEFREILAYPALAPSRDDFVSTCLELLGAEAGKVSFGTEGGCFAAAGIPSIVIGPGDIKVAHKPDEFIEVSQLEACADFLPRLIHEVAT